MRKLKLFVSIFILFITFHQSFGQMGWDRQYIATTDLRKTIFLDENTGFSVGMVSSAHKAVIYKTTNSGQNWVSKFLSTSDTYFGAVSFINQNTGYVIGEKEAEGGYLFMKTTNAGESWVSQSLSISISEILLDICFYDALTGYISGTNGTMLKSTNGGLNWQTLITGTTLNLRVIQIGKNNPNYVYTVGSRANLLASTNAGQTWNVVPFPSGERITSLSFANSNTGYAAGFTDIPGNNKPTIHKTTNAGLNWVTLTSNLTVHQYNNGAVVTCFVNENTGFITGSHVDKTTNGGLTWKIQDATTGPFYFTNIFFLNESFGYITLYAVNSWDFCFLKTVSGGNGVPVEPTYLSCTRQSNANKLTWHDNSDIETSFLIQRKNLIGDTAWYNIASTVENTTIYSDSAIDNVKYRVYASNEYGNSLYSNEALSVVTGVENITLQISRGYSLLQNYPNPFNPTTNIEFALPEKSFVKLKIFDFLGREVSELVNQNLSAGTYRYNFNGVNLASGMYFYKLETESFSDTKKMILVK